MKKKLLSLVLVAAMGLSMLVGCTGPTTNPGDGSEGGSQVGDGKSAIETLIENSQGKTIELSVWCSEKPTYQAAMQQVLDNFKAAYPTVNFVVTLGAVSEGAAKDRVLEDPEQAADIFVFADDQINTLVGASALQEISANFTFDPTKTNSADSVGATMVDGKMYAYPFTASNGYFLYYDSRYVSAEDAKSWDTLLAAAAKAGKKVGMNMGDAWYVYSFFAGAGLEMYKNPDGSNTCEWDCATGVKVVEAMKKIADHEAFISMKTEDATGRMASQGDIVAFIDGTWDADPIKAAFAEGYSATKLPTFKVDGKDVQMGSFAGYKLVGVNSYAKEKAWAMVLAEYITSEASQAIIGPAVTEAPANIEAAKNPALAENVALKGLAEQSPFADRQVVGDNYWSPAATLGTGIADGTYTNADLAQALRDAVLGITQPKQ